MRVNNYIMLVLFLCLIGNGTAQAVPAYNRNRRVIQPDGSELTIVGRGDEFCHFLTTTDGYTVIKDSDGYYKYADLKEGGLVPGTVKAYNVERRVETEVSYLEKKQKFLSPVSKNMEVEKTDKPVASVKENYRGLVILVNFSDRQFSRGDMPAHSFYDKLFNQTSFKRDIDKHYGMQEYTGSVRDYFSDNSGGQFAPEFDVVGPIELDESQYYIKGISNTYSLLEKVLTKADSQIDFSRYDSDGDGDVDMFYVIYAGYSSHYSGNDERLIWPHAGSMNDDDSSAKNLILDGVRMGRFACSAEIFGWQEDGDLVLDGIGVIVHEFSHVLGFKDHYDTSNGYQEHPNAWDIMSAGCYSDDFNRTPVAYNSYEKYSAGFMQPLNITDMDGSAVSLKSIEVSDDACILRSYQDNVVYLMENRQKDKWDKYLPGHGLLVWRVDSTNIMYWQNNALNVTTRACFRLVRACGTQGSFLTGVEDTDYDSFPGTRQVTELDNDDDAANLVSYDGFPCPVVLRNIREENKVISFDVVKDEYARNQQITYQIPPLFTATAERKVGEEWVPVSWTVTSGTEGGTGIITNLIPNNVGVTSDSKDYSEGVYVYYSYNGDVPHTISVNAQRVSLNDDYGTWFCDINDVRQSGTGAMTFAVDRYGIPTLNDSTAMVSFCNLKPKAYMVSQKNLIEELDVYRNIRFSAYDSSAETGIVMVRKDEEDSDKSIKRVIGGKIVIVRNGARYNISGQKIK